MPVTQRGYPYPSDADLIDVAGDLGRLAAAIDADVAASGGNVSAAVAAEAAAREARDNQIIADYVGRDAAVDQRRYDQDQFYKVLAYTYGGLSEDKIVMQGSEGWYSTDGYSTFVVDMPFPYPGGYYVPLVTTAYQIEVFCHAMGADFRTGTSFRCVARNTYTGDGVGAGVVLSIWWVAIGVSK